MKIRKITVVYFSATYTTRKTVMALAESFGCEVTETDVTDSMPDPMTIAAGDGNLLMAYVHVAHDCTVMNNIVMSNNATLAGHCFVDDNAIIGGLSAVHQFVRVGKHSFVGGMSGLAQDLPPWMLAVGNRATVQSPNIVGLRRAKASMELLSGFKQAYRMTWYSGIPRPDALMQLEAEYGHLPEIVEFINFVRESKRGILPGDERKKIMDLA